VDERIVERAQELLESRERDYESALAELALRNAELQNERERLANERARALADLTRLEAERSRLDDERRAFASKADERMAQALRDFVHELQQRAAQRAQRPKVTPSQSALLAQTIEAMHRDLGIVPREESASADDGSFTPDERVKIPSLGQTGTVVEDYGETLLIAIGPMKTVVNKRDVRRAGAPAPKVRTRSAGGSGTRMEAATRTLAELDVRGKRFVEAEPLVERWIDEAVLAGNTPLRLIHGKGTGMLGRGLQEYLRDHPSVKSVRYGNEDEGSAGVTIVELR